jgi:hypothetical protein
MRQVLVAGPDRSIYRRLGSRVLGGPEILSVFGRPGGQMQVRAKAGQRVGGTL